MKRKLREKDLKEMDWTKACVWFENINRRKSFLYIKEGLAPERGPRFVAKCFVLDLVFGRVLELGAIPPEKIKKVGVIHPLGYRIVFKSKVWFKDTPGCYKMRFSIDQITD